MRAEEMLRVPSRSTAHMQVALSLRPCPDLHPFGALLEKVNPVGNNLPFIKSSKD